MSDYNLTRSVSGTIVTRFAAMLEELEYDYEEEVVVASLVRYYQLCGDDEGLLSAIDRVLQDYMTTDQYAEWCRKNALNGLAKADVEDDLI